jgi:HTH-type transcriptional regulator, glycine betaine synthesis regulator
VPPREADSRTAVESADRPAVASAAYLVRTEGRDPAVTAFEVELVSFFVQAADLLGVPKSVAAIYGICFASPDPLSLADIDERLDISIGSISQGLRVLREVGALRVVEGGGQRTEGGPIRHDDRRDYYEPDLELRKLIDQWIEGRLQKQLSSGRNRLQAIARAVPAGRNGSAKLLRARLKALQTWHDKARGVMPIVKAFLKLT